jgi:hypothetical protein
MRNWLNLPKEKLFWVLESIRNAGVMDSKEVTNSNSVQTLLANLENLGVYILYSLILKLILRMDERDES